jgi:hypothetical protein
MKNIDNNYPLKGPMGLMLAGLITLLLCLVLTVFTHSGQEEFNARPIGLGFLLLFIGSAWILFDSFYKRVTYNRWGRKILRKQEPKYFYFWVFVWLLSCPSIGFASYILLS